jgi:hypothetical protein
MTYRKTYAAQTGFSENYKGRMRDDYRFRRRRKKVPEAKKYLHSHGAYLGAECHRHRAGLIKDSNVKP